MSGTTTTYEPMFREVPKMMYKLLNADTEWKQESDSNMVFTVKRLLDDANCITYFSAVRIGNELVSRQNYTAVAGSTVITLKNEYLKTFAPGEYTIEIEFVDGKVTAEFRIVEAEKTATPTPTEALTPTVTPTPTEAPTPTVSPTPTAIVTPGPTPTPVPPEPPVKTGDTSNLWLWAILAIIAAGTLGGVVAEKRTRRANGR